MISRQRPLYDNPYLSILVWCLLALLACGILAMSEHRALINGLTEKSNALYRLISQRVSQHDAHLTALSAIASAHGERDHSLFLDVATSITHFYPRIDDVQLVALDTHVASAGIAPLAPELEKLVYSTANALTGKVALMPDPRQPHHYLLIKRSPNTNLARYGLMLAIDAEKLLDGAGAFWLRPDVVLRLSLPDGQPLVSYHYAPELIQFSKSIGSTSQPLLLETGLNIGWADLLPLLPMALMLVGVTLIYLAALTAWRLKARAHAAAAQARVNALESRLAHASRVNALGEMASGLTHELTQPLTAILAQTQASKRLITLGKFDALESVLDSTMAQARRASSILDRFRNWSRPQRAPVLAFDLREALHNVQALLRSKAIAYGVRITFSTPDKPVLVMADPVEMEQVVFNLARNAIEALEGQNSHGRVVVVLKQKANQAVLDVSDNGPGIAPEIRDQLFAPFATTREGGTGLGLALSKRLVERIDGELVLVDEGPGATFRVVIPCIAPRQENER
ncbi:sensor histidine kinase [Pusillimonas sp. ANT_WB101]|uniref:sensor histidine kinase n=1 Tax=Pusillimonas sp. ANT_WB101 TaxID=2597356 RepID=UPI0011ED0CDF|nr:ATP-binding protein [Pusillimonas sp. ANT_WB101]KAA0892669.1 two-component sensor histidine kinase [Pusillimonas sp. ANT_WB101]